MYKLVSLLLCIIGFMVKSECGWGIFMVWLIWIDWVNSSLINLGFLICYWL